MSSRPRSEGLGLTRVGLWFLVFLAVILIAAVNTGNNGLFLVLAVQGGVLAASHLLALWNVRGLAVELAAPAEVFAKRPAPWTITVTNRSPWLPRWLLIAAIDPRDVAPAAGPSIERRSCRTAPLLVTYLRPGAVAEGPVEILMRRRGRHRVRHVLVTSLFPLGFFRKGVRYPLERELLIYPELFPSSSRRPRRTGASGQESTRRAGWGYDLLGLRAFRQGDDPRGIHWKQSARTGGLIFKERQTEESRRIAIVFDNAGELHDRAGRERFERLVSEAATAAVDALGNGYEVALVTRETSLPFAGGAAQRRRILETLAMIQAAPPGGRPLRPPDARTPHLRLGMERGEEAA